ncbi:DUF1396 domain-containing protein [Streptomyces sp. NA04227]|nr:DUF1396 domain-containing protein [Streptomyces sp. NA04227]
MRAVRKKAGVAVVAAALVCGAAACSSSSDKDGKSDAKAEGRKQAEASPRLAPAAAVKKATEASEKLTSFRYRAKGTVPGEGKVQAEAAMSIDPLRVSMKATTSESGTPETGEFRLIDGTMYIGNGKPDPELDNKSWIKISMDEKELTEGEDGVSNQAEKNPAAETSFLNGSKDLKLVGTETVEGVRTQHYTGTVTLDQMRDSLKGTSGPKRKSREKSLKEYESMGIKTFTMDMWADEEDHTKQFRMRAKGAKGPMDLTITFLDYNKPVEVKAPPVADTFDFAKEMEAMGAS